MDSKNNFKGLKDKKTELQNVFEEFEKADIMDSKHNFKSLEDKKEELQKIFRKIETVDIKLLEFIDKIENFICFYKIQNKQEKQRLLDIIDDIDSDDIDEDNVDGVMFMMKRMLKINRVCKNIFMENSFILQDNIITSKQKNLDILCDFIDDD